MADTIVPTTAVSKPTLVGGDEQGDLPNEGREVVVTAGSQGGSLGVLLGEKFVPMPLPFWLSLGQSTKARVDGPPDAHHITLLRDARAPEDKSQILHPGEPHLRDLIPSDLLTKFHQLVTEFRDFEETPSVVSESREALPEVDPKPEVSERLETKAPSMTEEEQPSFPFGPLMSDPTRGTMISGTLRTKEALRVYEQSGTPAAPPGVSSSATGETATDSAGIFHQKGSPESSTGPSELLRDSLRPLLDALRSKDTTGTGPIPQTLLMEDALEPLLTHILGEGSQQMAPLAHLQKHKSSPLEPNAVNKELAGTAPIPSERLSIDAVKDQREAPGIGEGSAAREQSLSTLINQTQSMLQLLNSIATSIGQPSYSVIMLHLAGIAVPAEIQVHRERVGDPEDRRSAGGTKEQKAVRVRMNLSFPSLGPIGVDVIHQQEQVWIKLQATSAIVESHLQASTAVLSQALRAEGYTSVECFTSTGELQSLIPQWGHDLLGIQTDL